MSTLTDRIKQFEGYYEKPYWDHKQWSVGYGSRASGPNDVVDRAEADRRLAAELAPASAIVDRHASNLPPGVRDSLVSLTYNAGDAWTRAGLGEAIRSGDMARARELFAQYNKASGEFNQGLANRRAQELTWWDQTGGPAPSAPAAAPQAETAPNFPSGGKFDGLAMSGATTTQTAATPQNKGLLGPILGDISQAAGLPDQSGAPEAPTASNFIPETQSARISYPQLASLGRAQRLAIARAATRRA